VACMREKRDATRVLVGKREVKRPFEKHRCRWGYNLKVDLQEMGREYVNWIDRLRLMISGEFECRNEPVSSIKCGEFLD